MSGLEVAGRQGVDVLNRMGRPIDLSDASSLGRFFWRHIAIAYSTYRKKNVGT